MPLLDRIGVDIGGKLAVEDAIEAAKRNGIKFIDVQLDIGENRIDLFDDHRIGRLREKIADANLGIGLHTLSAVNVAEFSPFLSAAVDQYMTAYVDVAAKLGVRHIVVHAGFHFTADKTRRMQAGLDRLMRISEYAEKRGVLLLLENMNKEPEDAEVRYLAHSVEEWQFYFDKIKSSSLGLAFTANHAHIMPDGVDGFIDAIPLDRVGEVRLADCWRNGKEEHLMVGDGDFDFAAMFKRLEDGGFNGPYVAAFVSLEAMVTARPQLVAMAAGAGVNVS